MFVNVMSSLTTIKGHDLKWRLIRSGILLLSYLCHGMGLGIVGPTMLDLQIRTNSSISDATLFIIGRAAGLSIGSFLAGPISSLIDTQVTIGLALILAGVTSAGIPWPTKVGATIGTFFACGFGYGIEETSLYLYMLYLWGSECEPFMQALHFSSGLGATIAPLIAREFILPRNETNLVRNVSGLFVNVSEPFVNVSNLDQQWSPDDVKIYWCYEIIAIYAIIVAIMFISVWKFAPESDEHPSRLVEKSDRQDKKCSELPVVESDEDRKEKKAKLVRVISIILLCFFCFFYCGIEVNFGSYLTPYAVNGPIGFSKSNGALIASIFWFVFTFSRIITVFYIKLIGSKNNLILCCGILILANVVLIPWYDDETCLWIGTVLIGIGTSSVFASVIGYIELSIKVTPLITSFTIASECLGSSIFPIITSHFFHSDPKIFLWLTLGATIAMAIFLSLVIVSFNYYAKLIKDKS